MNRVVAVWAAAWIFFGVTVVKPRHVPPMQGLPMHSISPAGIITKVSGHAGHDNWAHP